MALTTTTGFWGRRPLTISAARSMALASSTEVPPNFMTSMSARPQATCFACDLNPYQGTPSGVPQQPKIEPASAAAGESIEISLGLEQFRVQQGRAGGSANGVV